MLRASVFAFATVTMLGATAVSAQQVQVPGGPTIDFRNDRQRERDFRREDARRDRDYDRRDVTGSTRGCREITIRERDDYGRMTTRTREDCR